MDKRFLCAFLAVLAAPCALAQKPGHSHRLAAALRAAAFQGEKAVTGAKDVQPVSDKIDRELVQLKKNKEQLELLQKELQERVRTATEQRATFSMQLYRLMSDNQMRSNQCYEMLAKLSEQAQRDALMIQDRPIESVAKRYALLESSLSARSLGLQGCSLLGEDLQG